VRSIGPAEIVIICAFLAIFLGLVAGGIALVVMLIRNKS
jgi:hypothetical protein